MCPKMWNKFVCDNTRLQLKGTLNGGQSFRWKKQTNVEDPSKDEWIGIFGGCVWWLIQEADHILYKVIDSSKNEDVNLDDYYTQWSDADPYFKMAAEDFYGIRILKQDPVENIFSFICSSNNNISRITSMIEKMCVLYGNKICEVNDVTYYAFPEVEALAQPGVDKALRDAGFGYRAGYISKSANMIVDMGGHEWLEKLTKMDYANSKKSLMTLTGIGAKVADCICLMSLGHLEAIPVDTHIYQIAQRYYLKHLGKQKTVTEKVYNEIGDCFRKLYGPLAGWAHTVLFCADLKAFQNDKPNSKSKKK